MSIFKKSTSVNSQTCISVKYKMSVTEKEIEQIQYMTENYVYTEERIDGEIRYILIQNSLESPTKLKVDLQIMKYPGLGKTVFQKSNDFQQGMQLFRMALKANEIIKFSESVFSVNGQEQKSILELTEIKNKTAGFKKTI